MTLLLGPDSIPDRPYQLKMVGDADAGLDRAALGVMASSPPGSGKGVMIAKLARRYIERGRRVAIMAHRREIMAQLSKHLTAAGVPHGTIGPGSAPTDRAVHVCSVDTLRSRLSTLGRWLESVDLLQPDEAHHSTSDSWIAVMKAFWRARRCGWSASPFRLDGASLGPHFDQVVIGPSWRVLTELGWLAPIRVYQPPMRGLSLAGVGTVMGDYAVKQLEHAVDQEHLTKQMVEHWMRHAAGRPTIGFAVTVRHAHHLAEAFRRIAGIRAEAVDAKTHQSIRDRAFGGLADGSVDAVFARDLVSEGFDVPRCAAALLGRPTKSVALCLQQVGRPARPDATFDDALILDVVGNVAAHGMPDEPRPWSLLAGIKGMERQVPKPIRCERCYRVQGKAARCVECGRAFITIPDEGRSVVRREQLSPEMAALTDATIAMLPQKELLNVCRTRPDLIYAAEIRGHAAGWVRIIEQRWRENPFTNPARRKRVA